MKSPAFAFLLLLATAARAEETVSLEINVFQGFRPATSVKEGPPLIVYLPPDPGWSEDVERQRQQLTESLGLEGAATLALKRVTIPYGGFQNVEALQGRLSVSVRPSRVGTHGIQLDVKIQAGKEPKAVIASASVSGEMGKTFILGGKNAPLPEGWGSGEAPVFVAVTPRERFTDPSVWMIGGEVTGPKEISRVRAVYPPASWKARKSGLVVIEAVIDATGGVTRAEVIHRADPELDEAALSAVRQWRYEPATRDGKPVAVFLTVTMSFTPS
ncbi:MAG: energy transducer TonB [Thermoanaerobaculia bacterium]